MPPRSVPPSISATAFSCPHCGTYTTQYWFDMRGMPRSPNSAPNVNTRDDVERLRKNTTIPKETLPSVIEYVERLATGEIFFAEDKKDPYSWEIHNLNASHCYECKRLAIWHYDHLIYPSVKSGPEANIDLPIDVLRDYEEAQGIVSHSPRGAAALLRLAIQKLCKELGESGKNIDSDIASLVKKGLSPLVQKSLDIVRVIGNESVHPGVIDMRDNTETALKLFGLVNVITEQLISTPKHVNELYNTLPEDKRKGIDERDKPPT